MAEIETLLAQIERERESSLRSRTAAAATTNQPESLSPFTCLAVRECVSLSARLVRLQQRRP